MRIKRRIRMCLLTLALLAGIAGCTSPEPAPSAQAVLNTSPAPASSGSTANGYSYGYGTYYVATRRKVPPNWGDAKTWYAYAQHDDARRAGYSVGNTPKKGAIAWTDRGPYGQVAIVESVSADGKQVTISEMNGEGGGWNQVTSRTAPASSFKYIF